MGHNNGNLIPKQIINANGVSTTVWVRPDQAENISGGQLRGMGAPSSLVTQIEMNASPLSEDVDRELAKVEGMEPPANTVSGYEGDWEEGLMDIRASLAHGHVEDASNAAWAMGLDDLAAAIEAQSGTAEEPLPDIEVGPTYKGIAFPIGFQIKQDATAQFPGTSLWDREGNPVAILDDHSDDELREMASSVERVTKDLNEETEAALRDIERVQTEKAYKELKETELGDEFYDQPEYSQDGTRFSLTARDGFIYQGARIERNQRVTFDRHYNLY